jgi:hypothetical protein
MYCISETKVNSILNKIDHHLMFGGGRGRMVVGFTTTYANSAYHH